MNDNCLENFLYNVAWLRKQHGLSKKQMAQIMQISVWSLNKIERGEFPPRLGLHATFNISRHFHISASAQYSKRLGE